MDAMKQAVTLWQKYGAPKPRLQTVTAGELGHYVLTVQFENAAQYAKVVGPFSADPEFRRWQANNIKAGAITSVRGNLMRELDLA